MEGLKKKKKEEKNLVKNPPNFSLLPIAHCVKNPIFVQNDSFNIASEASELSGQKFIKNAKNDQFGDLFRKA